MTIKGTSCASNNNSTSNLVIAPTSTAAFRSSSSLSPSGAESPLKKVKPNTEDSKTTAATAPFFRPSYSPPYNGRSCHGRGQQKRITAATAPAAAAAAAPQAPACPYKRAADQTKSTGWLPDDTLIRGFTLSSGEMRDITYLGAGNSFQGFKFGDDRVIKVFIAFTNPSNPQVARRQSTKSPTIYDQRMGFLRKAFEAIQGLDIRSARILNLSSLESDGHVLQTYVPPITLSWNANSGDLSEDQVLILNEFLDILGKAFSNHELGFWDITPNNFALVDKHLELFDIPDQPMQDQWAQFPQAIYGWANRNPQAKALIETYLQNCLNAPEFNSIHGKIKFLIDNLVWP
jgi:hypothetical protein